MLIFFIVKGGEVIDSHTKRLNREKLSKIINVLERDGQSEGAGTFRLLQSRLLGENRKYILVSELSDQAQEALNWVLAKSYRTS